MASQRLVTTPLLVGLVVLALIGGLIVLGALADLTHGSPVGSTPYHFAWYQWSFEVFALIVTAVSIAVDFRRLRLLVVGVIAVQTSLLQGTIETVFTAKDGLPGSDGKPLLWKVTAAGLIIVVISNLLLIIAAGLSALDDDKDDNDQGYAVKGGVTV